MEIFVARDGKQRGPFSSEQLQQHVAQGRVQLTDSIWYEGLEDWIPLSEFLKLRLPPPLPVSVPLRKGKQPERGALQVRKGKKFGSRSPQLRKGRQLGGRASQLRKGRQFGSRSSQYFERPHIDRRLNNIEREIYGPGWKYFLILAGVLVIGALISGVFASVGAWWWGVIAVILVFVAFAYLGEAVESFLGIWRPWNYEATGCGIILIILIGIIFLSVKCNSG